MICELAAGPEVELGAQTQIEKLRRRDPDALTSVISRYQHRLYRFLLRLVGDPAMAQDLFQQTWLRVVERIGKYDASRAFEPWLFSVARNLAIDHLRRKQPESLDEPVETGRRIDLLAEQSASALDNCLKSERIARVMARLEELPAVYREVLTLRFEEEMKLEEISELTGTRLSTVKSRLRRALINLRERVEG